MAGNFDGVTTGITDVVRSYCNEQMGIRPESISVDMHNQSVTVTLEGVSHPAEINLARERMSCAMIEKMYMELFKVSKPVLHSRLERVLSRAVDRSFFAIESQYGNAVIVLFLSGAVQYPKEIYTFDRAGH